MIQNFLITAFRNLKKNILFSFINILGLAIGLAAAIIIYLWVYDELSYDKFHDKAERIYRIEREIFYEGEYVQIPITSPPVAPQMENDFPAIDDFTRLSYEDVFIVNQANTQIDERVYYADSSFFKVFSFKVISGEPSTALKDPFSVTMSESAAKKYFGSNVEPGKIVNVNHGGELKSYRLTAIFEDFPHNSHIQADIIASFSSLDDLKHEMMMNSWMASFHYSYVLLSKGVDPEILEEQLQSMVDTYFGPEIRNFTEIDDPRDFLSLRLVPVTSIHLDSRRTWEIEQPGSRTSVAIFSLVAILLLVIAAVNFMNLSTARASRRSLEVGVRKVVGASRTKLIRQFLGESLFFSFLSLVLAAFLIELSLPFFADFTGKALSSSNLLNGWNIIFIIIVWLTTSFFSGIYPAFVLSSYKPVKVLKGKTGTGGGQMFRKILVIVQFIISVGLIICSVTVFRHLQYINNKDLGYNRENLIEIPVEDRTIFKSYDAFSDELKSNPGIKAISRASIVPAGERFTDNPFRLRKSAETFFPVFNRIDENYIPVLEIPLLAGNNFRPDMPDDSLFHYIINDKARKLFGFESPQEALDEEIGVLVGQDEETGRWGKIIGVTEDFHFQSLTEEIRPMVMYASTSGHNHILLRIRSGEGKQINKEISRIWQKYYPDKSYISHWVSDNFEAQHLTERRLQVILLIFTGLSVFVACLGLFGLSVFSVDQRLKEIGIRKAMGAGVSQIVTLISSQFSRLVIIAIALAVPVSYIILREWLNNFPYRRGLEIWIFIAAAFAGWLAAFLTVSIQTYRAGKLNPAETLKYE